MVEKGEPYISFFGKYGIKGKTEYDSFEFLPKGLQKYYTRNREGLLSSYKESLKRTLLLPLTCSLIAAVGVLYHNIIAVAAGISPLIVTSLAAYSLNKSIKTLEQIPTENDDSAGHNSTGYLEMHAEDERKGDPLETLIEPTKYDGSPIEVEVFTDDYKRRSNKNRT
jgi:hypothetical protein